MPVSRLRHIGVFGPLNRSMPLRAHTEALIGAPRENLNQSWSAQEAASAPLIRYAMTYGEPSISSVLDELSGSCVTRFLVVPMYPSTRQRRQRRYTTSVLRTCAASAFCQKFISFTAGTAIPPASMGWHKPCGRTGAIVGAAITC